MVTLMTLNSITVIGKPMFLTCDAYAASSKCSRPSSGGSSDCETCCNILVESMFDCPTCRYFVLSSRRQGSSCFCTICFKEHRHRRYHQQEQNDQILPLSFGF